MPDKSVAARLELKPGQRLWLINPPPNYREQIGPLPAGARLLAADEAVAEGSAQRAEVVQAFFGSHRQLAAELPAILAESAQAVLWICYPNAAGDSQLSRQAVHNAIRLNGWRPVAQIRIDQGWSAIRARPA
ncbi:MAG TPA: hypothetical protein VJ851_16170 [Jatrophihabitans sp.]|nr:hypothetical protein [Jatrophihabitans sp.]